ncbi:peptidoglycan hydrolase-like protein with peptidoglycan-binding domain [Catenuloplanes nepalensis]|uniref:Peptidoglycan hydrolase-like protein with peptidoglycan-binding domain n=1 Tax=Catenuloplanes nepalensis TaxID=587533 RepID=A0ABT9MUU4_9ACTN|nr:peptidoglycan-binding protein [Catenuloplanes nepalensis]MDP9795139.1 peptidoglycan hydrolase-like protein with peptidoglycan-binding domain [Catenuloplanes nepalensis]
MTEGPTPIARRRRLTLALAAVCAVLSTAGLLASTLVKSPQQLLADSSPPPPTQLTAAVEKRVLTSTVVARGTVEASARLEITPTAAEGAGTLVLTAARVEAGAEVKAGQVLLAVSGRPLIVLKGAVPAYRDLKPGDTGADVTQLQKALRDLRHYQGGDTDGTFGGATKDAVRGLYQQAGYDVPDTGGPGGRTDRPALTEAAAAVDAAHAEVSAMRRRIKDGPASAPGEAPLTEQLARLEDRLADAVAAEADLIATTGPMVPLDEVAFVPEVPARVSTFTARVGDQVEAPLIVLSSGALRVAVRLRPEQAGLIRADQAAALRADSLGQDADATVTSVGELTTDPAPAEGEAGNAAGPYHPVLVTPKKPLPAQWAGQDVRVTITAAQTDGEVLVVPLSAVSAGADGRTTVSTVDATGAVTRVEVRAGASGDGFVAVSPAGGELAAGDRVVVSAP